MADKEKIREQEHGINQLLVQVRNLRRELENCGKEKAAGAQFDAPTDQNLIVNSTQNNLGNFAAGHFNQTITEMSDVKT